MSFTRHGRASIIVDGQFGSTGKGLIAASLALKPENECQIATTNASANAGHTSIIGSRKFITFHLPTFAVVQQCVAYLNAGAIINPKLLFKEMEEVGFPRNLLRIHPRAAVITDEDVAAEASSDSAQTKLASTRKGVGTALANKILRRSKLAGETPELAEFIEVIDLHTCLNWGDRIVVEIPQGFSLGINSGFSYPYCTSRDVTVMQGLADACIHPVYLGQTMMSLRTYPIRVGNIIEGGVQLGTSGPCYPDQEEITFESIGQPEELTTVTKRIRRIFSFSTTQYRDACEVNRPDLVFLNFCNYLKDRDQLSDMVCDMTLAHMAPTHFGFGPAVEDVVTSLSDALNRLPQRGI